MIEIVYDKEIDTLVLRISGKVKADTYKEGTELIIKSAHFHPGIAAIWDFRDADIRSLTSNDAYGVIEYAKRMTSERGSAWLTAVVASEDVTFGMARMLELLSESAPYTMMVFHKMEDARKWIRSKNVGMTGGPSV